MSLSEPGPPNPFRIAHGARRRLLACLVVVLILVLFTRLAYVASQADTGWETIAGQWRDATIGPFVGNYVPISLREPVDQATYWLRESERVQTGEPDNAELAMASALLLDSPSMAFEVHHMTAPKWATNVGLKIPELDNSAIKRALQEFNVQCRQKCLAEAARATELQPSEVRWWRLRAMTLFDDNSHTIGPIQPHVTDWLRVLQQCQDHDPDNALYDYLIARYYFDRGVDTSKLDNPTIDQANFDLGMQWFLRGQRKAFCDVGGGESHLLFKFLQRTRAPRIEYRDIIQNRYIQYRIDEMARCIARVLWCQAERQEKKQELASALTLRCQAVHLFDQFLRRGAFFCGVFTVSLHSTASNTLEEFVGKHPGIVSAVEATRIGIAAKQAKIDKSVVDESNRRLTTSLPSFSPLLMTAGNLADACVTIVLPLLLAGAIMCIVASHFR